MCVCVCAHKCHGTGLEVREQPLGVGSLLYHGFQGIKLWLLILVVHLGLTDGTGTRNEQKQADSKTFTEF